MKMIQTLARLTLGGFPPRDFSDPMMAEFTKPCFKEGVVESMMLF